MRTERRGGQAIAIIEMAVLRIGSIRVEAVKKSWDRLPACHFPHIFDRLEAYPTNKITAS
jgi:hypothetical protein